MLQPSVLSLFLIFIWGAWQKVFFFFFCFNLSSKASWPMKLIKQFKAELWLDGAHQNTVTVTHLSGKNSLNKLLQSSSVWYFQLFFKQANLLIINLLVFTGNLKTLSIKHPSTHTHTHKIQWEFILFIYSFIFVSFSWSWCCFADIKRWQDHCEQRRPTSMVLLVLLTDLFLHAKCKSSPGTVICTM